MAMDLIKVQSHNFLSLNVSQNTKTSEQKTDGNLDLHTIEVHYADLLKVICAWKAHTNLKPVQ